MGGAISGITSAVSGVVGAIGTNKALNQEKKSINKQQDIQKDTTAQLLALMAPYRDAGTAALPKAQALAGQPIDREKLLNQYFSGDEYAIDSEAARRQQLAGAAATGGLGSTSTNNALAAIAPTLGNDYLNTMSAQQQDMYNQLMGMVNVGLQGAGGSGNAISSGGSNLIALQGAKGANNASRAALPYQTAAYANNAMGQGAASDVNQFTNMFGGMFGGMMGGV